MTNTFQKLILKYFSFILQRNPPTKNPLHACLPQRWQDMPEGLFENKYCQWVGEGGISLEEKVCVSPGHRGYRGIVMLLVLLSSVLDF